MKNFNIALENESKYKQHAVEKYAQIIGTDDWKYYIEFKLTGKKSYTYKEIGFDYIRNVFKAVSEDGTINYWDIFGNVSPTDDLDASKSSAVQVGRGFANYLLHEPMSPYLVCDGGLYFDRDRLYRLNPCLFANPKFAEMIKTREKFLYKKFLEKKLFKNYISAIAYKLETKRVITAKTKFALEETKKVTKQKAKVEKLFAEIDKKYPID